MSNQEVEIALLRQKLQDHEKDLSDMKAEIRSIKDQDKKRLLWGIAALGSVVMGLGSYIWVNMVGGK